MSRPSTVRASARVRALKPTPPPAPMKARLTQWGVEMTPALYHVNFEY